MAEARLVFGQLLAVLEALGIGPVAYSPLGKGFLTGTIDGAATLNNWSR
ncbi:hypothetical protein [Trichlorobacter lovleyi]|nr:hypothetical protein [Trichlorobacter lovleyi]